MESPRGRLQHVSRTGMVSLLRTNHLVARLPSLSLKCAHNFTSTSNAVNRKPGNLPNSDGVTSKEVSDTLTSPERPSLATSLAHYSSLPPLPPTKDWVSHFSFTSTHLRDRVSIRTPESAINVAHSFIDSKKTFAGSPKVIVEAFPGVWRLKAVVALLSHPV
jgi:hypothetical protein